MNYLIKLFWLVLLLSSFIVSCSESPQNDGDAKAPPNIPEVRQGDSPYDKNKVSPDEIIEPGGLSGVGSAEVEALKKANLVKPMIYGVGGAGITIDTTFEESQELLTPPFRGPFADGATLYNEQIIVVWNLEGSRKPFVIYFTKGYLGQMDVGGKFGKIDFQTKFREYKGQSLAADKAGAAQLARDLYNTLEKQSESFDCIATGACRLVYGTENQANMVLVFPGSVFLIAKEEFQIAEIRLFRNSDPGPLANNVDLLSGDVLVPEEEAFSLGQTKEDVFGRLEATQGKVNPEIYINTDSFVYAWRGFYYVFQRTNYVNTAIEAENSDVTAAMQVTSEFPAYLTLDGQRILMTQSSDDVAFDLEDIPNPATQAIDDLPLSADVTESKLKMTTEIYPQNARGFSDSFAEFLKTRLSNQYDTVQFRSFGYQNDSKREKEISTSLRAYNKDSQKGISVGYQVSQQQKRLGFVSVSRIDNELNPFNKLTLPASLIDVERQEAMLPVINKNNNKPVLETDENGVPLVDQETGEPKIKMALQKRKEFTTLAGIKLNDLLRLSEIDALGRGEATVEYITDNADLQGIKERGAYTEQGTFDEPDGSRPKPREQSYVSVGVSGTLLGIQAIGQDDMGLLARVVSIGTNNIFSNIQDLCGLGINARFTIGMTDNKVVETLQSAIDDKVKIDPKFNCDYFIKRDNGSLGLIKEIYFPGQRMVLSFSNRALGAASIYLPLNEVDTTLPEVKL